jgi:CPA1 family monovalent cation:H+ antiporter
VPHIVDAIRGAAPLPLAGRALLVSAVVMGVRFAWMFLVPSTFRALSPFARSEPPATTRGERVVLGWSGMRGGVSLAAALAIPLSVHGAPFPDRELVIFLAYVTVVITLLVPGATLAPLVRRLGLGEPEDRRRADSEARLRITHAALERLEALASRDGVPDRVVARLRDLYEVRLRALEARMHAEEQDERRVDVGEAARLQAEMIEAERDVLRAMRRERAFPADLLREVERELDLDESRLRARIRS